MNTRQLVAAFAFALVALPTATPASAEGAVVERTAPYDFGCIGARQECSMPWEEARNGVLRAATAPIPGLGYSWPPLPIFSSVTVGSLAGVTVTVPVDASVTVSAHLTGAVGSLRGNVHVCLQLRGERVDRAACTPVPTVGQTTVLSTTTAPGDGLRSITVSLVGSFAAAPVEVSLDRIRYEVHSG